MPRSLCDSTCGCAHLEVAFHLDVIVAYGLGQAVKWLWETVGEFDDEERRRFLKFFTGSDRAPIGGLSNLRWALKPSSVKISPASV